MYCQSCGARNADEARFCNMCGTRIAAPGTPGGPLRVGAASGTSDVRPVNVWSEGDAASAASTRPSTLEMQEAASPFGGGPSMSSVSLRGIGVQPRGRVWLLLGGAAIASVALGAVVTYLAMSHREKTAVAARNDVPPPDFDIGTPLPTGADTPDVDFVSGGPRPVGGGLVPRTVASGGDGQEARTRPASRMEPLSREGTAPSSAARTDRARGQAGDSRRERGSMAASREREGATPDPGPTDGPREEESSATGAASAQASPTTPTDEPGESGDGPSSPDQAMPPDRDLVLEMYAGRVRYVIRRYYAVRAQSCFESASRNDLDIRGTVVIAFTIGADGHVTAASVASNTTGNEPLGRCLASAVRQWRLPAPPGGPVDLEMPFSR